MKSVIKFEVHAEFYLLPIGGIFMCASSLGENHKGVCCIRERDGIVDFISSFFTEMTSFKGEDLIDKSISEVFEILRIGPDIDINEIDARADYFLFSKNYDVLFVRMEIIENDDSRVYIFNKIHEPLIEDNFMLKSGLYKDSTYGIAVYSLPDNTLIMANDRFFGILSDKISNNKSYCIGKHINGQIPGFKGSSLESGLLDVLKKGEFITLEEFEYRSQSGESVFWKVSLIPADRTIMHNYCIVVAEDITENVLTRKKLEELEVIFDNIPEGIIVVDSTGKYIKRNKKIIEYMNKADKCEGITRGIHDTYRLGVRYYDTVGNELTLDNFPVMKSINMKKDYNERVIVKQGERNFYIDFSSIPVLDVNGDVVFGIGAIHNVTEQVYEEILIKDQMEQLQAVIENMNDAIAIFDSSGKVIMTNIEGRSQYPTIDTNNKLNDIFDSCQCLDLHNNIIPNEKLPTFRALKGEKIKNERIYIKYGKRKSLVEVNAVPIYDIKRNLMSVVISHHDLSRLAEYEEKLIKQRDMLQVVIENANENIVISDAQGRFLINKSVSLNGAAPDINNIDDVLTKIKYFDINHKELPLEKNPLYRVRHGEIIKNEINIASYKGRERYFIYSGRPIYDDEKLLYVIGSNRDITEVIEYQRALKEAQEKLLIIEIEKNEILKKSIEMKDDFLSLISHELRTPLNVINSAIQAMEFLCSSELSEKTNRFIKMIKQNIYRQLRLVNNLLDITRVNSGRINIHKRNIDMVFLTGEITKSVSNYAAQKNITVSFKSISKSKIIGIDDEKYERILLNLLSNAIKFTPEGKSVDVSLSIKKGQVYVKVKDMGIGIPEDKMKVIFERFGQVDSSLSRQAEGAGIGLSLVKKFTEAMEGSVSVKSTIGKGSTFTIILPAEKVIEEKDQGNADLMGNRIVEVATVEFSDIYL